MENIANARKIYSLEMLVRNLLKKMEELCKINPQYDMDYIKIHKLLYLAQCYVTYTYGIDLFKCPIIASNDGPYILKELNFLFNEFGADKIKNIDEYLNTRAVIPFPYLRASALELILRMFGIYSTDEIVRITNNTYAYQQSIIHGCDTEITRELMIKTGEQIQMIMEDSRLNQENLSQEEKTNLIIQKLKKSNEDSFETPKIMIKS